MNSRMRGNEVRRREYYRRKSKNSTCYIPRKMELSRVATGTIHFKNTRFRCLFGGKSLFVSKEDSVDSAIIMFLSSPVYLGIRLSLLLLEACSMTLERLAQV